MRTCLCFVFIFFNFSALSQDKNSGGNLALEAAFHYGSYFTTSSKASYIKDSYSGFGELTLSKPVIGFPQHPKRFPLQAGAGLFFGNTGSRNYMGNFGGGYGFFELGIIGNSKWETRLKTGFGVGFVEKPYDIETNHKNLLIGSKTNIFLHANLKNVLRISPAFSIHAGLSISHLSNGSTKLPNLGINIPAISAGATYMVNCKPFPQKALKESFQKKTNVLLQLTAGVKQSPWVGSKHYGLTVLTTEILRQVNSYSRFGVGLSFLHDPSRAHLFIDPVMSVGIKNYNTYNISGFLSYEIILGKVSVPVQAGYYIIEYKKRLYQNYGIRYSLTDNWSAAGFILAHFDTADFLHGGIIYHLK